MGSGDGWLEWLWRPMLAGLCHYESIKSSLLDLADIAEMNELLDVRAENERRFAESRQPEGELVMPPPPGGRV